MAFDIETDGRHPLACDVRCIGFFDGTKGLCVPLLYRDGATELAFVEGRKRAVRKAVWKPYFTGEVRAKVKAELQLLFKSSGTVLRTQNGQYDRLCLECREDLEVPSGPPHEDSMLAHHVVASYLPHDLGFLGSLYTDICHYKATEGGAAWSTGSDHELALYCIRDCKVTWLACEQLAKELRVRQEDLAIYRHDARYEQEGQRWKKVGLKVDLEALDFFRHHYRAIAEKSLKAMREVLAVSGKADVKNRHIEGLLEKLQGSADEEATADDGATVELFNPGSLVQLRMLLQGLGIPLSEETATGQLSTAKDFLLAARKELIQGGAEAKDARIAFLDYLFSWREAKKIDGTYLSPEILSDGRVHPSWSVHVTPTGRLSSSNMNMQNQPAEIRGMYVPEEGRSLVMADADSLEMRILAFASGDKTLVEEFAAYDTGKGPKIHILNMAVIFRLPATQEAADKHPGCYRAAKVFAYLANYGGGPETSFEKMREEMPDMEWEDFKRCDANYRKKRARLFSYQSEVIKMGAQNQYLDSPVLKRRAYFFERGWSEHHPEAERMANFPIQSAASDIVGLANFRVLDDLVAPLRQKGHYLEQLAQVHDELLFEVPDGLVSDFSSKYKIILEEPPGEKWSSWRLPWEVKTKKRWKDVLQPCSKCKDPVKLEPIEHASTETVWKGECKKCKTKRRVVIPKGPRP